MEASIVDLRYKMKGVLQSLKRNEDIKIYYHNTWVGTLIPRKPSKSQKRIKDHPFFGMHAESKESVEEEMQRLRGGRFE